MRIHLAIGFALFAVIPLTAQALTLEQLRRYDKDGNLALDEAEMKVYQAHLDDPILAKYDIDANGRLDPNELKVLRAEIEKRYGDGKIPPPTPVTDPKKLFALGKNASDARRGDGIPIEDLVQAPKIVPDECKPSQELYVRRDRLDTFLYGITPRSKALGASVSFTGDEVANQRTATINGMIAYVPPNWRDPCIQRTGPVEDAYLSAYAIAPWISAHGSINDPVKKTEKSALAGGFDAQFTVFGGPFFNFQAFKISPYVQTDFRGVAQVGGLAASWQPTQYLVRLGGSPTLLSENFDWYWQLQAEVDAKRVDRIGYTDLDLGRYAWVGGTVRVLGFFFPTNSVVPEFLQNRLNATLTFQAYQDQYSSRAISMYSGELAYNITADGNASVSVGYQRGTDKDTLTWLNQYVLRLNYKY